MSDFGEAIGKRSVWQVFALYLGGAFVALQAVEQVVESAGFPDWVRAYSLVLLILLLPIVLITAAVQRRQASLPEGPGQTGGAAPGSATTDAGLPVAEDGVSRLFTWRNAFMTGAGGVVLIGVATAAYLILRAAGIGPAGTLSAQGSIEEGATVVLTDFESADAELGGVVTNTLRIDLLQSPFLDMVEEAEVSSGLTRMELESGTPVTPDVARELAIRDGYDAIIAGEVGSVGEGYVLTARIMGGDDWTTLAAFRSTARSGDDLIDAIEDLSRDIRDKSGEPLRSVHGGKPLRAVTTSSLPALRAFNRGAELWILGEREGATEAFERAIALDPEFAMAHRRLGVILGNRGIRRTDQLAAATRAFELRDRLPEIERLQAEASYYTTVGQDIGMAMQSYEDILDLAPENRTAKNNLSVWYRDQGRFEEAEQLLQERLEEEPYQVGINALAATRLAMGNVDGAHAALDWGVEAMPQTAHHFANRQVSLTVAVGDLEQARDVAAGFAERFPSPRDLWRRSNHVWLLETSAGRLQEAEAAIEGRVGENAYGGAIRRAFLSWTRGDSAGAAATILDAFDAVSDETPPRDRPYGEALSLLLRLGEVQAATRRIDEWEREVPFEEMNVFERRPRLEVLAELSLARDRTDEALERFDALERGCPLCGGEALYGRGRAYEARGEAELAIEQYERYLEPFWQYDTDPLWTSDVLQRLARLSDEVGAIDEATAYYERIARRWADADSDLQPIVRAAEARLAEVN